MRRKKLNISKLGGRILEMRVLPPFVLPEIINALQGFRVEYAVFVLQ